MATFKMTCSCGDAFEVDAKDRDEAVEQIQSMMSEEAVNAHMKEKHPGEPVPSVAQVHQMVAEHTAAT